MSRRPGSVIYTALLNERGIIIIRYNRATPWTELYCLFVKCCQRDLAWLKRWADGFDVTIADETYAVLGLMGPVRADC